FHERDGKVDADVVSGDDEERIGGGDGEPSGEVAGGKERAVGAEFGAFVDDARRRGLRVDLVELGDEPVALHGEHSIVGERVGVEFDDGAAGAGRPRGRLVFVAFQHADVVERGVAAGAEERGPVGADGLVEPESAHEEGRGTGPFGDLGAPGRAAEPGGCGDEGAQSGQVGGEYHGVVFSGPGQRGHRVAAGVPRFDPGDRGAGEDGGAVGAQVVGERLPQGAGEGGPRHVEEQSFAGAEEVDVEHGEQFGRGQGARVGEEAAGEHFERQVAGGVGEPQPVEEVQRVDVVELLVDVGDADVEEGEGRDQVDAGEVAPVEAGAAG